MQLTKWAGKVPYLILLKCSMDGPISAMDTHTCGKYWAEIGRGAGRTGTVTVLLNSKLPT